MSHFRALVASLLPLIGITVGLTVCLASAVQAQGALTVVKPLQPIAQSDRIGVVNNSSRSQVPGHVPLWAQSSALSVTPVNVTERLRLTLLLRRSAASEQAFQTLLLNQQTPGSALYHVAISPQQLGALYGPTDHDIAAIEQWAQSQGLTVGSLSPSRTTLDITGTVTTVESALRLHFSMYNTDSGVRRAPDSEPQVPTALSPVIDVVAGLTTENGHPLSTLGTPQSVTSQGTLADRVSLQHDIAPLFTGSKGNHFITPADFAKIYDITPIYTGNNMGATIGGTAQHIAIIADSDADAADVQAFFTGIGSNSYNYKVVLADGSSPGYTAGQGEAELDLERVLGTAPGVTVDLVEGAASSPLYDAARYAINTLQDPIITMSFGECETDLGASGAKMWQDIWATAAANMTSVFVSGGDSGAAACDTHGSAPPSTQALAINGYCSTISNTCVGGTEFNDTANPSQYWSATNDPTTKASVLGYIPEGVWNDPTRTDSNGNTTYIITAGGGGISQFVAKPAWQTGPGVPNDGFRDTPDISFSASAIHDPYYYCGPSECTISGQSSPGTFVAYSNGGTSAAAPTMAAITALLNTAAGAKQGNLNPTIYRLANSAVASQIFHDVTVASSGVTNCDISTPSLCNNSTPGPNSLSGGQPGYLVGPGYDQATGWGSLDVANFIKGAQPVNTSLALSTTATVVGISQAITATATLTVASTSLASPTGTVQFFVNGSPAGSPVVLSNGGATSASISFATSGPYSITAMYSGDALYISSSTAAATIITVAAQPPSFVLTAMPASLTFVSGSATGNSESITLTATNNYAGAVGITCSISSSNAAFQPTCAVLPGTTMLAPNGTSILTVTISSTTAHATLEDPFNTRGKERPFGTTNGFHNRHTFAAGMGVITVFLSLPFLLRRRRLLSTVASALFLATLVTLSGCSSNNSPTAPLRSSSGTYTVTVTGSGTGSMALSPATSSTTFSVTIL